METTSRLFISKQIKTNKGGEITLHPLFNKAIL